MAGVTAVAGKNIVTPGRGRTRVRHDASPRGRVLAMQRRRMIEGLVETIEDRGWPHVTVGAIVGRAGVSRKTFYELFADRESCLLAAFEETVERARDLVVVAFAEQPGWRAGIRAALARLLTEMDADPGAARLFLVDSLAAGERVQFRRMKVIAELTSAIDRGGHEALTKAQVPTALTAEGLVGAVCAVLRTRLLDPDAEPASMLLNPLMSMIVLPYLGPRAARRELHARSRVPDPVATLPTKIREPSTNSVDGLRIRLTYRTVRVLSAIAEHPGVSNRRVAESADMVDQGQASKLLIRLAGAGLIENERGRALGGANSWRLTDAGQEIYRASCPR